ncbi:MAG: hypothetical protein ACREUX_21400 [Burkholderiales bacterium]
MKWLPRTLFGQLLAALAAGLLAAQAVGAWLMLDDRSRFAGRILGSYAAERVAGIVSLLDDADAEERDRLVRALSVPPTRVSLEEPWRRRAERLGRKQPRQQRSEDLAEQRARQPPQALRSTFAASR